MSNPHVIDGEEPLFDFDSFESLSTDALDMCSLTRHLAHSPMTRRIDLPELDLSSFSAASTPAECADFHSSAQASNQEGLESDSYPGTFGGKGKGTSRPVDIQPRDTIHPRFDAFSFSSSPSDRAATSYVPSSSTSTPPTLSSFMFSSGTTPDSVYQRGSVSTSFQTHATTPGSSYDNTASDGEHNFSAHVEGKGKFREAAPCLPPLSFSPTEFARGETDWPIERSPSPEAGPSRLPQLSSVIDHAPTPASSFTESRDPVCPPLLSRMPSRRRSFSSLSARSAKSIAARSMSRIKLTLGRAKRPGNLARKLLSRKQEKMADVNDTSASGRIKNSLGFTEGDLLSSLRAAEFHRNSVTALHVDGEMRLYTGQNISISPCHVFGTQPAHNVLKCDENGSYVSYASTFSQTIAALDLVLDLSKSDFEPIRVTSPNLFDGLLPKELKLSVLKALVEQHVSEQEQVALSGAWTALKASSSKHRWVGRDRGIAELVKLSRVSKTWQSLVFDGQLWPNLQFRAFPRIPSHLLSRLTASSGRFVRSIDFTGHSRLSASGLLDIVGDICNSSSLITDRSSVTQLTDINLTGCSSLTTSALHDLLIHSPSLLRLRLKGLTAVTNTTCQILASHCPRLLLLDMSWCHNMDADGIRSLIRTDEFPGDAVPLKELRISGLRRTTDELMAMLGKHLPHLEVLDLSGIRELHSSALDAFTACSEDEVDADTVLLTSREAGHDPGDPKKYKRRVTRLRHLSLSSCPLLSDAACLHLAYAVPRLEYLELAGIGSELKDDGLVKLLNTTPRIRRVDLEEACDITDAVLEALTPPSTPESRGAEAATPVTLRPGTALEHLVLSYAVNITNDAVLTLIRACTRLRILELDNTRVSGATIKDFVRLSRKRQVVDGEIVAIDCRSVSESIVKELAGSTRTRKGWRSWEARKLGYLDVRDEEGLGVGQDECDEKRIVVKSFYSWQIVDAVEAAREKRRKAIRKAHNASRKASEDDYFSASKGSSRWWSPGLRRSPGPSSPTIDGSSVERDGCVIM